MDSESPRTGGDVAAPGTGVWSPPEVIDANEPSGAARLQALLHGGDLTALVDPLEEIASALVDLRPGVGAEDAERARARAHHLAEGTRTGVWVHFPWNRTLVHHPSPQDHLALRTLRNRDLVTAEDQERLSGARIAVFGLSVGSNVVEQLVRMGIGAAYLLADPDRITPANLNRMRATMADVGSRKTDAMARTISQIDPFAQITLLHDGWSEDSDHELEVFAPDVVFEEVDDLGVKARLRQWAAAHRCPLMTVSDVGENSVLDVERHDLTRTRPFNGKVSPAVFERAITGGLVKADANRMTIRLVGARNLNARLIRSFTEVGITLAGVPQLSSSANAGAAIASVALRELLTTGKVRSGRYVLRPRALLRLGHQAGIGELLDAVRRLRAATRR